MDGILLIDKPKDWTSHDVIAKLRGILGTKKVGHTGTLDPMATGLLVICIGRATKLVDYLTQDSKQYLAGVKLGTTTTTDDVEGEVLTTKDVPKLTKQELLEVLATFKGKQKQVPPKYSAIKINGRKLYDYARKGIEVDIPARDVEILKLDLVSMDEHQFTADVSCSKGTYIRSLARDIGAKIGCGATLSSLRRTIVGNFRVEDAQTIDELQQGNLPNIQSVDSLIDDTRITYTADDVTLQRLLQGQRIKCELNFSDEPIYVCNNAKELVLIANYDANKKILKSKKVIKINQ